MASILYMVRAFDVFVLQEMARSEWVEGPAHEEGLPGTLLRFMFDDLESEHRLGFEDNRWLQRSKYEQPRT